MTDREVIDVGAEPPPLDSPWPAGASLVPSPLQGPADSDR